MTPDLFTEEQPFDEWAEFTIAWLHGLTEEELGCLEDAPGPWGWDK